jgi:hypothetical protein
VGDRRLLVLIVTVVALVAGAGLVLIATTNPGSVWTNVGQALLSGAVLGGIFLAIEKALAAEGEHRSREAGLRLQLTTTEALAGIDLRGQNLRGMYLTWPSPHSPYGASQSPTPC